MTTPALRADDPVPETRHHNYIYTRYRTMREAYPACVWQNMQQGKAELHGGTAVAMELREQGVPEGVITPVLFAARTKRRYRAARERARQRRLKEARQCAGASNS